jgi:hypothetical protein
VQFEARLREGLRDGSITVAFRSWKRRQVVPGGRYRTGLGMVEATAVERIDPATITEADARAAGYSSADAARADLRAGPDRAVFRVEFRPLALPDPRSVLAESGDLTAAERAQLDARLAHLADRWVQPSPHDILRQIAVQQGVVSMVLAAEAQCARPEYKRRVRALKELGLTVSLEVGYRLSARGEAYLAQS